MCIMYHPCLSTKRPMFHRIKWPVFQPFRICNGMPLKNKIIRRKITTVSFFGTNLIKEYVGN